MLLVFGGLSAVLGAWLIISPFIFGYTTFGIVSSMCIGVVVAILGCLMTKRRSMSLLAKINVVLGVVSIVSGIASLVICGKGANLIVCGILVACVNVVALPFMIETKQANFENKTGSNLAKVTSVKVKGDHVLAKAVLLGSMPETIYVRPEELIKMLVLMDDNVIKGIVKYLMTGYKNLRTEQAAAKAAAEQK